MFLRITLTVSAVFLTLGLSTVLAPSQTKLQPPLQHHLVPTAQPAQPFSDPHGRYRLSIPSGWDLTMSGDDPTFHNGVSWIQVRLITANTPSDAVDQAVSLFRSQFTNFNTINRGNTTIAGRPSHGLNVDGMTPTGQRVSVLFTAQPEGKKQYLVLVSVIPVAQAPQLNTSVMALANSVRFNGE